jgi:hypothetical protein
MLIQKGNLRVVLNNDINDKPSWNAYLGNNLIAVCAQEDWDLDTPDFFDVKTGELLLNQYIEIFSSLLEGDKGEDESMFKTDSGVVEDNQDDPTGQADINTEDKNDDDSKVIIIKLNSLLRRAENLKNAGLPYAHVYKEIDAWLNNYNELKSIAIMKEIDSLYVETEFLLNEGLDCTAQLNKIEKYQFILDSVK